MMFPYITIKWRFLIMNNGIGLSSNSSAGIALLIVVFLIAAQWKLFVKAGKPGWASIVPIYNVVIFLEIVDRPLWWLLLLLLPIVNIIVAIILCLDLAEVFGKSKIWGFFMLCILAVIGIPILAFGEAEYITHRQ
jgi:hypothetical protein